ncbi:MAG: serine/threonine protein kinase, partial [Planctomycetes bacterium]|nr:serine/threonine protein kinase [Planctomycetota bacterium]
AYRVLLADFGLAKQQTDTSRKLTVTGALLGTPAYMSPEQAMGDPVDARSDVYSLAAVLYEMLDGASPFASDNLHTLLQKIIHDEPPPLPAVLNADLRTIASKGMAKEKSRRYATAREFADDLDRFLDGEAIAARPASFWYRLRKRASRHRALTAASLVACLALFGFSLYGMGLLGPAWIVIEAHPGGSVYVSQVFVGESAPGNPAETWTFPSREALIEIKREHHEGFRRVYPLSPFKTLTLSCELRPAGSMLKYEVSPPGARVYVKSVLTDNYEGARAVLAPFLEKSAKTLNDEHPFRARISSRDSRTSVFVSPLVEVFLDPSALEIELPNGACSLEVTAPDHAPARTAFQIQPGQPTELPPIHLEHEWGLLTVDANTEGGTMFVYSATGDEFAAATSGAGTEGAEGEGRGGERTESPSSAPPFGARTEGTVEGQGGGSAGRSVEPPESRIAWQFSNRVFGPRGPIPAGGRVPRSPNSPPGGRDQDTAPGQTGSPDSDRGVPAPTLAPPRTPNPRSTIARPIHQYQFNPSQGLHRLSLPVSRFKIDTGYYRLVYWRENHFTREAFVRIDRRPADYDPVRELEKEFAGRGGAEVGANLRLAQGKAEGGDKPRPYSAGAR